jgi:predicted Ser/Thr protein kinase
MSKSSSGASQKRTDKPSATKRGQIISYLVRRGYPAARVNQLIKSGMSYDDIARAIIQDVQP